ncbi:MAG: PAS domain-containing sensor histidine kinase [Rhodothermales bacterium]|nr:PAS domain-containing sensor histidine kinase [Rhodothermales bacterium]
MTSQPTIDQSLMLLSHQLAVSAEPDIRNVLGMLGRTIDAECLYLVRIPNSAASLHKMDAEDVELTLWHRKGQAAEDAWWKNHYPTAEIDLQPLAFPSIPGASRSANGSFGSVLPIMSDPDNFYGYLGIECEGESCRKWIHNEEASSTLSSLLVSYLRRREVEQSLLDSEERWRSLVDNHPEPILITAKGRIVHTNEAGADILGLDSPAAAVGRSADEFVEGASNQSFAPANGSGRTGTEPNAERAGLRRHRLRRVDGGRRKVESVSIPITYDGKPAVQTVLRDITEQGQSEERFRAISQTIAEAVWRVELKEPLRVDTFPQIQVDHILEHGHLIESNEVATRLFGDIERQSGAASHDEVLELYWNREVIDSFVRSGYRLSSQEVSIVVSSDASRHFLTNAIGTVEDDMLVGIWGSCIEVTDRVEMERRLLGLLEEEQERIGRDLHDSVGQLLTGIRMLSSNLAAQLADAEDEHAGVAQRVADFAAEASMHIADIHKGLAPPQLYNEGVVTALEELCTTIDSLPGASCRFEHDGSTDISDPETKRHLYRIAQEAVNNALKHAEASEIVITLERRGGKSVLEIRDDGKGFNPDECSGNSLGLYNMRHRASFLRAEISIESRPGTGTRIACTMR